MVTRWSRCRIKELEKAPERMTDTCQGRIKQASSLALGTAQSCFEYMGGGSSASGPVETFGGRNDGQRTKPRRKLT